MIVLMWACMLAAPDVDAPALYAGNEELRGYLSEAVENNPGLKARYAEWRAALERIPQAKALDDPMFSYTYFLRSGMKQYEVSLEQKFPWFGTLRERGDKTAAAADGALAQFYAARNQVISDVKKAYFEYAYLAERERVTQSQAKILTYMEEVAHSKYSVGMSREDELLRIQIKKAQLEDDFNQVEQLRPAASARLCVTLGRETGSEDLPWPQPIELPPPPPPAPVVVAHVRTANPDLLTMNHTIDMREHEVKLAKKKGYPEFSVKLGFGEFREQPAMPARDPGLMAADASQRLINGKTDFPIGTAMDINRVASLHNLTSSREATDEVMLMVGLSLPIWRTKVRAGIEEAKQMESAAVHEKRSTALSLEAMVRTDLFEIQDGRRRYALYHDTLLPQAQESYESLQSAYASGGLSENFIDVLDSITMLLEFQLNQAMAARDVHVASAELERIMGGPWTIDAVNSAAASSPKAN